MSSTVSPSQSLIASSTSGVPPDPTDTDNTPAASQATLYLYTFLVTLVVLFALTGGIVARSCFIRRRSRLRMEEAVRNGTFVPPSRRPKLGDKPVLHDVDLEKLNEENAVHETEVWHRIRPVAVVLSDSSRSKSATRTSPSHSSTSVNVIDWFRPTLIRQEINHNSSTEKEKEKAASQTSEETPSSAQVTFLVAMPVPHKDHGTGGDKDNSTSSSTASDTKKTPEIPLMDFGILEATVKDPFADSS